MLDLKVEKSQFVDSKGETIEYNRLYVEVYGVKVYLQTKDKTGQSLVVSYLEKGVK